MERHSRWATCLLTPYSPASGFPVAAPGRNKIIYAPSRCTIIVSTDNGTAGVPGRRDEALKHQYRWSCRFVDRPRWRVKGTEHLSARRAS